MTKIAKHARELLTPYANVWADMVEKIEALDADELADLTKACDSPTNTNCWWERIRTQDEACCGQASSHYSK